MIIDAHHHLWDPARGDYGWLTPDLEKLYRVFSTKDLLPLIVHSGIEGTVLVQAAPTVEETDYMLSIAAKEPRILGVVGWADFETPGAAQRIAKMARNKKLVGLRPMIQDIPDDDWMLKPTLSHAFEALAENNLCFDALVFPRHLKNLHKLLRRHPDVTTIIDHGAKPDIANHSIHEWAADLAEIAQTTDAFCKLSGLVTEAAMDWKPEDLRPYFNVLLATFGPNRLIWGSDWPVLNLASDYATWFQLANEMLDVSEDERAAIFGGNAARVYGLA